MNRRMQAHDLRESHRSLAVQFVAFLFLMGLGAVVLPLVGP
jgi:hypothetical protein